MKSYSEDLRERIVKAREEGKSAAEAAKMFAVCKRTVERYWKHYRERGHCKALPSGGRRVSRLRPHLVVICKWIEEQSDLTLSEMAERLRERLGVEIGSTALWHQIDKLGMSYKKKLYAPASRGDPT